MECSPQTHTNHSPERRPPRSNAGLVQIDTASGKPERTEFGYARTTCACASCVANCHYLPGYLLPQDVERIADGLGYTNLARFAVDYLLASVGATVMNSATGRTFQIPTLVPRRCEDVGGACVFLDNANRCRIHAVSPYGCSFFDCRQTSEEANRRSARGLEEIARQWAAPGRNLYTALWRLLYRAGLLAIPAAEARARMAEARDASEKTRAGGK